jgi:hypothetical protein
MSAPIDPGAMIAPIEFPPAVLVPRPPNKEVRVQTLKDLLKQEKEEETRHPSRQSQAINIEKVIAMYENNEIHLGQEVWLINGRVVKQKDKDQEEEGPRWREITFSPAIPHPHPPITKEVRVKGLKNLLKEIQEDPPKYAPPMLPFLKITAINVEKMIALYENNEISFGQEVFLVNGCVVKEEDFQKPGPGPRWHEV